MARRFESVTWKEFAALVEQFPFRRKITDVHLHHTWKPRENDYDGERTILGMWRYHTEERGWSDIAQHVTIAPDGKVWLCRNFDWAPASAKGHNGNSVAGPFMIEMIGNFDVGEDEMNKAQREAAVAVIKAVQQKAELPADALKFHRDMSNKTCPGDALDKSDWITAVGKLSLPRGGARSSPFEASASRTAQILRAFASNDPQTDLDAVQGADHPAEDALFERGGGSRGGAFEGGADDLTLDQIAELSDHVITLNAGQFTQDAVVPTDESDVDRIFERLLPAIVRARGADDTTRVVFYAHGGLVSESRALQAALKAVKFWKANKVYPVFFIWNTDFITVLRQLMSGALNQTGSRDFFSELRDGTVEEVVRLFGGETIWGGMKRNAELASDEATGGASYVAKKAAEFLKNNAAELHTVGHSAGAIFQAHFMQRLIEREANIKTAHYLAPAIRNDDFHTRVATHLGKEIGHLSLFTMRKHWEVRDTVTSAYGKSLLYLVSEACEVKRKDPLLGLEISLLGDPEAKKVFGLGATRSRRAEVIWSQTDALDGIAASRSTTHGGFDDDPSTMESVLRRIIGNKDGLIAPFPELDQGGRNGSESFWSNEVDIPDHLRDFFDNSPTALPSPVAAPAVIQSGHSVIRRSALCIGVDNYRRIGKLNGCINDAKLWQTTLRGLGYEAALMEDAEAQQIRSAVGSLITNARPGDSLVFQFAGHGTQFRDLNGDEASGDTPGKDECICAVDCGTSGTDGLVLDDEFRSMFARLPEGAYLTCFFDCCHSGTITRMAARAFQSRASGSRSTEPPIARFHTPTPLMERAYRARIAATRGQRDAIPPEMRDVQYAACRSDQLAYESNRQGDFTRHACGIISGGVAGLSNSQFRDRVTQAFGSAPQQNPEVNCMADALARAFLQSGG